LVEHLDCEFSTSSWVLEQITATILPKARLETHEIVVRGSEELNGAFAAIARERADAVVVQGGLPVKPTVDLALKYQLASLSTQKSAVQAGILMSYSASF
jgi:putative tryptophan/tyrosine transport system substrate-binding protein